MTKIKVGINGLGRIGKMVFRLLLDHPDVEIVGMNDTMPKETLIHLLKYDTVHGMLKVPIVSIDKGIIVGNKTIEITHYKNPEQIPCKEWGVDVMLESSGQNKTRGKLEEFLKAGAKRVILSCPSEDQVDKTIILGVNDHLLTDSDIIISNASCTANCVAPLLYVLEKTLGIETVFLNTVHPITNNQNLVDAAHKDLRRARASGYNIIPTSTSSIKAILEIMPGLNGRFDGISTRVPVLDGALSELVMVLKTETTVAALNEIIKESSLNAMKGIIDYTGEPIVSSDIIGNFHSCIFDSLSTKVLRKTNVQLIAWYDNEYGYSNRIVDLMVLVGKMIHK